MATYDVWLGEAWLGTVRANTDGEAMVRALQSYGQHLKGAISVVCRIGTDRN